MTITIYHNPDCSKSRQTLEILESAGVETEIIEYLHTPPDSAQLKSLLTKLGLAPNELIRSKESLFGELALEHASDDELIAAMCAHPILIERPVVVVGERAVIGRPPDKVRDLLD